MKRGENMLANIIGVLVISVIFYYVGRVLYKKINPDSDCGSCSTCDQNCPFSGGSYNLDLELDEKDNTQKDNKDYQDTKNEDNK